jgi:hypothetical protein
MLEESRALDGYEIKWNRVHDIWDHYDIS